MLEVLLLVKSDEEVKYACVEMLNHLGVPYREIEDLEILNRRDSAVVLILPEASRLSGRDLNLLWESSCPVIFVSDLPEMFLKNFGMRLVGAEGKLPPKISGLLKADGVETVPFFYDFPILESDGDLVEKVGGIEVDGTRYLGVVMSKRNSRPFAFVVPQIFRSSAYLLGGGEESLPLSNEERAQLVDRLGRIDGGKTEIARLGFLRVPIVNVYEELLLRLLLDFSERKRMPLVRKWLYPRNYDAALCVTHDVEHAISPEVGIDAVKNLTSGKLVEGFARGFLALIAIMSTLLVHLRIFKSRQSLRLVPLFLLQKLMRFNPLWNFDKLIDVDKEFAVVSSFHFLANVGPRDSDYDFRHPLILEAMNFVRKNGCRLGLHASFNSYNDKGQLRREKGELEEVLGMKVRGIRQHYYRFEVPGTWKNQEEAGFLCDSSFGYAQQVGFRAGTCLPFKPFDRQRKKAFSLLEVSRIIEDGVLLQEPYMALSFREAFEVCKDLIEAVMRHHGVITLGWHESIDREWTRDWFVLYKKILQYCSKFNLWKTTVEDLARRYNTVRSMDIEMSSSYKNSMSIEITSPNSIEDFVLRIHMPSQERIRKIFANKVSVEYRENTKDGTIDACLNVQKGKNGLKILFSKRS